MSSGGNNGKDKTRKHEKKIREKKKKLRKVKKGKIAIFWHKRWAVRVSEREEKREREKGEKRFFSYL